MTTKQQGGCLTSIFSIFGGKKDTKGEYGTLPYYRKQYLLTQTEQSFYHMLVTVLNGHFVICPKVRMSDIIDVDRKKVSKTYTFLNKINSRHVDFLVCDAKSMSPLVAIELDDKSHQKEERQKRDFYVDKAFADANMPLVRFQAKRGYVKEEIIAGLKPHLTRKAQETN